MRDPVPLRLLPDREKTRAGRSFDLARYPEDWALGRRAAVYWSLRARIDEESRLAPSLRARWGAGLAGAAAVALTVVGAVWLLRPVPAPSLAHDPHAPLESHAPEWTVIDLADLGTVELSASAAIDLREQEQERQIYVAGGTLRAQVRRQDPRRPLVVVTPHLRVVVLGTRFDVHAETSTTRVEVLEGKVRVEAAGLSATLVGGEAIRSDDRRLRPAPGATVRTAVANESPRGAPIRDPGRRPAVRAKGAASDEGDDADCTRVRNFSRQKRCLLRQARSEGLAAQNALYALALLTRDLEGNPEQALDYFRLYEERFPAGVLAPEVTLGFLETLREQGRIPEAAAVAAEFTRRFAEDPRAPEVALVRAELLCKQPAHRAEAYRLVRQLERSGPAGLRDQLARVRERCPEPATPDDPLLEFWNAPFAPAPPGD